MYLTPIIAALLGELVGHWLNDFFAKQYIKRVSLRVYFASSLLSLYFSIMECFVQKASLGESN